MSGNLWRVRLGRWEWVTRGGGVTVWPARAGRFERAEALALVEEFWRLYGEEAEIV